MFETVKIIAQQINTLIKALQELNEGFIDLSERVSKLENEGHLKRRSDL